MYVPIPDAFASSGMSGHGLRPVRSSETGTLLVSVPAWPRVPYGLSGCQSSASTCQVAPVRSIAAGAAGSVVVRRPALVELVA